MARRIDAPPCPKCGAKWCWYIKIEAVVSIAECGWFDDGLPDFDDGRHNLIEVKNPEITCMQCKYVYEKPKPPSIWCKECGEEREHEMHDWQNDPLAHGFVPE